MPAGSVNGVRTAFSVDGFIFGLGEASTPGTIRFRSHDWLEGNIFGAVRLGILFAFFVDAFAIIQQVFDTIHIAVIG